MKLMDEQTKSNISKMINLMDTIHEHLTDPNGFLDKEYTRDNILELQKLCGQVAAGIDEHFKKHLE